MQAPFALVQVNFKAHSSCKNSVFQPYKLYFRLFFLCLGSVKKQKSQECEFELIFLRFSNRLINLLLFLCQTLAVFTFYHTINTYQNKRNTEYLSHVEQHGCFPCFLHFFSILNQETSSKNSCQTEAKEKPTTNLLRTLVINDVTDNEKQQIAQCFV